MAPFTVILWTVLIEPTTFDLNELADAAGVTTRTIRYYVAQGLLPSPATRGPGARYDRGHLDRLQLIKRLQRQHLPLAEIRRQLESLDDAGVREALRSTPEAPKHSSALSYVRALLEKETPSPPNLAELPSRRMARGLAEPAPNLFSKSEAMTVPPEKSAASISAHKAKRSIWDRVTLSEDVELHVRRPLTREQNRQVEQLLEAARHIFAEEP